jgi:DNA anti-recombination protein RmuC
VLYDLAKVGVGGDFLDEVGHHLQPGKVAVVAEVYEEWVMPVDTRMEAAGGVVFRRARAEVLDSQIERDATALKAELADLKAERARANKQAKAKLQAKINSARAKLEATQDRAKAAAEAAKREMDAKVKSLKEQVAKAQGDAKAKLEARIAEVQSEYKRRSGKLHQAWELTKEALAL